MSDDRVLLASGRDADVFAVDELRVVRRYRTGGDVQHEMAVMAHVAAHGYPVPIVYEGGGADMTLQRLNGPTLLESLTDSGIGINTAAEHLVDLHHRLREVPGHIVHLDLHPANIILTAAGPYLIDWRNAGTGPGDLDVAVTALILAEVAVDPSSSLAQLAKDLLHAFLRRVGGKPLDQLAAATDSRANDPALSLEEKSRIGSAAALVVDAWRP